MEIKHKFQHVEGNFDTDGGKLSCTHYQKYDEVLLCFKANMSIPFATIKLYSSDRWADARDTFNDAGNLGDEIAKRWNQHQGLMKIAEEALELLKDGANEDGFPKAEYDNLRERFKEFLAEKH